MDGINFPFALATEVTPTIAAGAATVTVQDNMTIIKTGALDAALTLTLTAHAEIRVGAQVLVVATSDGTGRNVTFAGDATAIAISGTANKTKTKLLMWDGTKFRGIAGEQVD